MFRFRIFFAVPPRLENNARTRRESARAHNKEGLAMNEVSVWIEHLRHPLVLAGFGLFVFALIIKPLFLNNSKLTGTAVERLLHKAMILLFILAAIAVAGGIALSWKATPAAGSGISLSKEEYRQMLHEELRTAAKEMQAPGLAAEERRLLELKAKTLEERLADFQKSYEEKLALLKAAEKALDELKGQLPDARLAEAKLRLAKGDTKAAEQIFDEVADKEGKAVALAAYQSGQLAAGRFDYAKAMRQYKKAVTLEEDNPDYLLAVGMMARTLADYSHAQEWLERLLQSIDKKGKNEKDIAFVLNELALVYNAQGRYAEAEPLYKRALEIREQKLGKDHPDVATTLNNLAWLYYEQGRYKEAEPLSERTLEIREQKLGDDHPDVAATLNNLAGLYEAQGRYKEAEPLYKRALEIRENKLGKDHPDVAVTLNNLAGLYQTQGRHKEAELLYQRALDIFEKTLGKDHPGVAATLNNLAGLYKAQGRYEEAEPFYQRDLEISEKTLGKDHPSVAATLNNLASLYYAQGRHEEAEPLYQRSLEIKEKTLGKDHPDVAATLNNLASLYYVQGKYAKAEPLYPRAIAIMKAKFPSGHPNLDIFQKNYDQLKKKMQEQPRGAVPAE